MSEEILRALMELFAIIIKQDGGITEREKDYVQNFLTQQIGAESSVEYYSFFLKKASDEAGWDEGGKSKRKLTSVLDSVKILQIGKQINNTLDQRQKIVVLVRTLELINTEYKLTDQRLGIIKTLADIFKVSKDEYSSIILFVTSSSGSTFQDQNLLVIQSENNPEQCPHIIKTEGLDKEILVLRIPTVELYFLKYSGSYEILLNGYPIISSVIYLLANGSSLRMPVGLPVYYSDIVSRYLAAKDIEKLNIQVENLSYRFPGNVTGLDDVSFEAQQGNLVGIMGASGSGKTTLLNVLAGIYKPSKGSIRFNAIDFNSSSERLRGIVGYVPQDDLLIEELSVFDNLYFNAKFCFSDLNDKEIREKVNRTLENLGLVEKKDLRVGSPLNKTISGGQRKRLNIALELIREPSVLYLDEPTSGLSSRDSENVMDLLRELSFKGKLIFIVIHQPSSELYKMFDRVIILDEGGKLVYYGNPVEAVVHFRRIDKQVNFQKGECPSCGNVNPEQIFNIIEARQVDEFGNYTSKRKISPEKWKEYFKKDEVLNNPEEMPIPSSNLKLPGWLKQCFNYLRRDLKTKLNNTQYMILLLGVSPLLAIILSYIIRYIADPTSKTYVFRENENIPIYLFMAIIVALFLGLIMSAEEIFRDRKILRREKFLHLSKSSYLLAKIINIMLVSAIQTILFVFIANPVLGIKEMMFHYWLALFSVAASANMIGLLISSTFNSAVTIYIIIPLVMIPMMVLSGAMFSFEKLNRNITSVNKVPVIADLMSTKWAYEALMVKQFKDNRFESEFFDLEREISRTNFKSAYYIPELEKRLALLNDDFQENGKVDMQVQSLHVLRNEILREQDSLGRKYNFTPEQFLPSAYSEDFSSQLSRFISELNNYYLKQYMVVNRMKQNKLNRILSEKKDLYYSWLDKYHNENLADNVKKIYEKNKIVESNGRLYQQSEPIYLYPDSFRAHFYSPVKRIGDTLIDTYTFNIITIWCITLLLYVVLYYDVLFKLINTPVLKRKKQH